VTANSLCVHAHFYQPPRENPWTEEVPREPSAGAFHDWNTRIAAESYRPNAFARILDREGRVLGIVNNYQSLSFNVGPTLMSWLERHQPDIYDRIRGAHAASGGAIAQAWNHMILPLASERDVRTQIRWGLADFRHRFGVEATGMWLPETAVNPDVLRILAEEGVGFTILAPSQVSAFRPLAGAASPGPAAVPNREWQKISGGRRLDTRMPYRWLHPSGDGPGVDLVVYDGGLSHALAFEPVSSETLVDRAAATSVRRGGLVTIALDGETFGHHHKWADRTLAYALTAEAPRRHLEVTNVSGWLRRHRPVHEAQVRESAWSCAHGVGRWFTDCGCSTGGSPGSNQRWRAPLREALDQLRDFGVEVFERRGGGGGGGRGLFAGDDPWAARDAYVDVLIGAQTREQFATRYVTGDPVEAFTLLEAQRNAMLMYTSCGWFFHDLAGLETVQVLRYAARVLDLLTELGEAPPEDAFLDTLARAQSHDQGDGRAVWSVHVIPARVDAARVASHLVLGDLFGLDDPFVATAGDGSRRPRLGGFDVESVGAGRGLRPGGDLGLAWRRVRLTHRRTGRAEELVAVGLRLGDVDTIGAVRPARWPADEVALDTLGRDVASGLPDSDLTARLSSSFGPPPEPGARGVPIMSASARTFDTSAMLPEAAEALLDRAAAGLADHLADAVEPFLAAARWASLAEGPGQVTSGSEDQRGELPAALRVSAEVGIAHRLQRHLAAGELEAAVELARRARRLGLSVFASPAGEEPRRAVSTIVLDTVRRAVAEPGATAISALAALDLAAELGVEPDLDEAQELVYERVRADCRSDLEALALALGLSPALFEPEAEAPASIRTSA
jgi:alpha-amylase/alpha-mannosidase (GH57 family)